jgi:hypothetical protein
MKYIANPIKVEAFKIAEVYPVADQGGGFQVLKLEDGNLVQADKGMLARMSPQTGDYWVVQSDGYVYLNPKDVFERKYRQDPPESEILTVAFGRVNLLPDGEIELVELTKGGQRIGLTREQARSLSNQIAARLA